MGSPWGPHGVPMGSPWGHSSFRSAGTVPRIFRIAGCARKIRNDLRLSCNNNIISTKQESNHLKNSRITKIINGRRLRLHELSLGATKIKNSKNGNGNTNMVVVARDAVNLISSQRLIEFKRSYATSSLSPSVKKQIEMIEKRLIKLGLGYSLFTMKSPVSNQIKKYEL